MTTDDRPDPAVGGVVESCLYAEDLDPAAAFYERVIGLERFAHAPRRHVFFRCGHGVFLLFQPDATAEEEGESQPELLAAPVEKKD